jgi:phosphatidylglycerol---prolipoprotein diacylglyceryl transferase
LHAHLVFECLGYFLGFQLYLYLRRRYPQASVPTEQMVWILVGAVFGGLIGAKWLAWLEHPTYYWSIRHDLRTVMSAKTVVGGILGAWLGVEFVKLILHVNWRTGDLIVLPLAVGIAVGRVGCFLAGLADGTHGTPTSLPVGFDFGDGIRRHPAQLYEIVAVVVIALVVWFGRFGSKTPGTKFRLFILGYLLFRFAIELIKPSPKGYIGLSAIQWACLVGSLVCVIQLKQTPSSDASGSSDAPVSSDVSA